MNNILYAEINFSSFQSWLNSSKKLLGLNLKSESHYLSAKKSKNGKGTLYLLNKSKSITLARYELVHEDGRGSILVIFSHLGQLYKSLDQSILKNAQSGNLARVESIYKQRRNMQINLYTHRLQIYRTKQGQHLEWLIDLDFHKSDSYGSGTGSKVIKAFLLDLLEQSLSTPRYQDYLDMLLEQNLPKMIEEKAKEFYPSFSQERVKCIVSKRQRVSHE